MAVIGVTPVGKLDKAVKGIGIIANRAKGKAGEALTEAKLLDEGTLTGKQVTIETSTGKRTVIDFIVDSIGGKGVVETKTGAAKLSPNQSQLFSDIENGRSVTPRGRNAFDAGLDPNRPTVMRTCAIDRC